jgi:ethanolamine utilization microcompartment shell protein EutS
MLRNLVRYVTNNDARCDVHALIDSPIRWGDYPTERGVAVEPLGGLVVNCRWQPPPTAPDAPPLPDNEGAWNTRPGEGFLPHGRRVFGPWSYTNATGIRDLSDPVQAEMLKRQLAGEAGTAAINPPELDDVDNAVKRKSQASPTRRGQFWARIPAGQKWCVNKVENPSEATGKIAVQVNAGASASLEIPPGETATVKCEIAGGATTVNVKYVADKTLVLLETSFE